MKIYGELSFDAIREAAAAEGIQTAVQFIKRSRVRKHGWNVTSWCIGGRRWKNTGYCGASALRAASWDQHGRWFARLFKFDPNAVIVAAARYEGAEDFHTKTGGKYRLTS